MMEVLEDISVEGLGSGESRQPCANECCRERRSLIVPNDFFEDGEKRARERFRNSELTSGVFISPYGLPYCSRGCWASYCED